MFKWEIIEKFYNNQNKIKKVIFKVSSQEVERIREFNFFESTTPIIDLIFDVTNTDEDIISYIKDNLGLGQKDALEDGIQWDLDNLENTTESTTPIGIVSEESESSDEEPKTEETGE